MSITVCLSSALRKLATGEKEVSASTGTVREILKGLSEQYPDLAPRLLKDGQLAPGLMIYVGDTDIRDLFEHILQEGQGKIIELSSAPTSSQPLLEAGEVGKYGSDIYWRIGNTISKFT